MNRLKQQLESQQLPNGYELIDGVEMHAQNSEHFHIPPPVIKKQIDAGHFVEIRVDSTRFSMHEEDAEQCSCPSCNGALSKPILRHDHPASLLPLPDQAVPSRGWGEDFWVKVLQRSDDYFIGKIDNPLVEARLHELRLGSEIAFHENHILAVHGIHRQEIVAGMNAIELKQLAIWLGDQS